jgi:hypothetical protein
MSCPTDSMDVYEISKINAISNRQKSSSRPFPTNHPVALSKVF